MSYDWGPHFIVPSKSLKDFSGAVRLREKFDEDLLRKELEALGISGAIINVTNPWYYRKKGTESWVKIGESDDRHENFPVRWDTSNLDNGKYEVLGLMHVIVKTGDVESVIARQSIVEVTVEN
jgi:hypothetical protein